MLPRRLWGDGDTPVDDIVGRDWQRANVKGLPVDTTDEPAGVDRNEGDSPLKDELQRELDDARIAGTRDRAEVGGTQEGCRSSERRCIQEIEDLRA
jgi:hypothetical protein